MNKYHIRIDGIESEGSFTYQELVDMGLFNLPERALKGIEVKRSRNKVFKPFKTYPFPESQSNDESFYVDEYGQIHRKEKKRKKQNLAYVDEYGQIVRPNNSGRSTSSNSTRTSNSTYRRSTPSNPTNTTNSTNNSDNSSYGDVFFRIFLTLIVLSIGIPLIIEADSEVVGGLIFIVGWCILSWIWGEFD